MSVSVSTDSSRPVVSGLHHVGVSVRDLNRSLTFWEGFLGVSHRDPRSVSGDFIETLVGVPGIHLEIAWLDIPGGPALELVENHADGADVVPAGTIHAGGVHFCLAVPDVAVALDRALAAGGTQASARIVEIPAGPFKGARHVFVRDPDGASIELRQPPAPVADSTIQGVS